MFSHIHQSWIYNYAVTFKCYSNGIENQRIRESENTVHGQLYFNISQEIRALNDAAVKAATVILKSKRPELSIIGVVKVSVEEAPDNRLR